VAKTAPTSSDDAAATPQDTAAGKGRPTPSRAEREAANKRPLVPDDRKQARKENRAKMQEARQRAQEGMARGDLPARDKGPQKRYVRDYVDARWSVGEVLLPLMFLVIVFTMIPDQSIATYALLGVWAFIMLAILDCVVLGFRLRKKLAAKFGADKVEKITWYAAMRALQLRPLRLPKPQVKRGQFPS
jgi:hypothetical protein